MFVLETYLTIFAAGAIMGAFTIYLWAELYARFKRKPNPRPSKASNLIWQVEALEDAVARQEKLINLNAVNLARRMRLIENDISQLIESTLEPTISKNTEEDQGDK